MEASKGFIVRLLNGDDKRFVIPVYQRPYSWKKSNCELLFKDLMDVYKQKQATHFFGSIVYVEHNIGISEYVIIDGQQRLTTVSLLFLAIRNYVIDSNIDTGIDARKITTAYLIDEYAKTDNKKLRLKLVQGDGEAYDRLIENTEPIVSSNVSVNYFFFYNLIKELAIKELEGLYDAISKLEIVNISLDPNKGDDPQLIFESLNSTGLDLEESDKIRNYVLMKMNANDQEQIYKNYWERLEKIVTKEGINGFIRHYLAVKTRELANENKLYFAFKNYRENKEESIIDILSDMLIYAGYYSEIKLAKESKTYIGVIARINKLEINTVTPLLFDLFKAKKEALLEENEMKEALLIIESYIVRRIICGLPTSSLNKIFMYLGAEIDKYVKKYGVTYLNALKYSLLSKTQKSRFPSDHDFAEKFVTFELYNSKAATKKYLFERLENYKNKERVAVEDQLNSGELTIEHIMPQSTASTKEWRDYLGDKWELVFHQYIDTVGNLTLTAYNSDYSNLLFDKKRDMIDKGFSSSKLQLNKSLAHTSKWGEAEIQARAKELFGWAQKIWTVPQTDFVPTIIEEWVFLDEDFDFTNKAIAKYNLLGDEVAVDSITDMYKKINVFLYSFDTATFASLISTTHNSDPKVLRDAYEISKDMYIEMNLNSQAKIGAISNLFIAFGIDMQELKFLVRPKKQNIEIFNIEDETTYISITAGELAYKLISKLFQENKISNDEISHLMEKEYTRAIFKKVFYPVLALTRDANKGTSKQFRYYKLPIRYEDRDIYISSQWFDESREDLICWYKQHHIITHVI